MPTLFRTHGYRFYFFTHEHEPIHVHVNYQDATAKIQIIPEVKVVRNHNMKQNDLNRILFLVKWKKEKIIELWHEYIKDEE